MITIINDIYFLSVSIHCLYPKSPFSVALETLSRLHYNYYIRTRRTGSLGSALVSQAHVDSVENVPRFTMCACEMNMESDERQVCTRVHGNKITIVRPLNMERVILTFC